ncbi:MAG TPA: glycosyltransferase [Vicinamibacteria bacterium]|nr:glycosyltransferase [Vicinamibacteria bacterium]
MDERSEAVVFFIDAGGGHRAAAHALEAALAERPELPLRLRPVPLQRVLAPLDFVARLTGISLEEAYNGMVRRGRTRFLVPLLRGLQLTIRARRRALARLIAEELHRTRPAVVVSVTPNFNAAIRDAVHAALPSARFVVMLTDFADFPPHFWIEPGIDRVLVATEHAAEQAVRAGLPRERVTRISGLPLHPRFYPRMGGGARARVRAELGFVDEDFVALLLFGGKGAPELLPLAEELLRMPMLRVVAVCGDNPPLFDRMGPLVGRSRGRLARFGFTDRIPELLAAADVLVTKPGPGSLAEAFHQQVPVVVTSNGRTIPQERWNARFVEQKGLGLVVQSHVEAPAAVHRIATEEPLRTRFRFALRCLGENRAIDEALDALAAELRG